jgi:hypothetical protein
MDWLSVGYFFDCNILGTACVCAQLIDVEDENIPLNLHCPPLEFC